VTLADVQFTNHDRTVVARLLGEIDLSNAEHIGGAIGRAMPNHTLALVLDLSEIDFLDSAGIQLLYQLRENLRARDQALRLVIPPDSAASDALRLAGISGHIETAASLDDALREVA
jgi:anti-anti-sigma factor